MADASPESVRLTAGLAQELRDHLEACEPRLAGGPDARWCRDLRGSLETLLLQQGTAILSLDVPLAPPPGFRQLLADVFGEGFFASYRGITDCRGREVADFPPAARCIHGHFAAAALRARFPAARLITWVSDPVRRVAAHYRYWQREPDEQNPLCAALRRERWPLLEFARQDGAREELARCFGGLPPSEFAFIGLREEFPRSVDLLMRRLQVTAVPVFQAYLDGAATLASAALAPAEAEAIAALNPDSCRLYAECRAWFERACSEAGI